MPFWKIAASSIEGDMYDPRVTGRTVSRVAVADDLDISYAFATEVPQFRKTIFVPQDGIAFLSFLISMQHRGISAGSPTYDPPAAEGGSGGMASGVYYPIGISGVVMYRRSATEGGLSGGFTNVMGTLAGGQISDRKHHYGLINCAREPFEVDGGYYYQFTMGLSSHSDAGTMNGVDGAAELNHNGGANCLIIEYEPGAMLAA